MSVEVRKWVVLACPWWLRSPVGAGCEDLSRLSGALGLRSLLSLACDERWQAWISVPWTVKWSSLMKRLGQPVDLGEEPVRHIGVKQAVAVLPRGPQHACIGAGEPAEEQGVVQLLDQPELRTDGIERLQ